MLPDGVSPRLVLECRSLPQVGEALGREAAAIGRIGRPWPGHQHEALAAVRSELRVPLRGPLAAGELATAMVQGMQSQGIGTSVKHYAANNQEDDRLRVSAEVDERTLREIYLPAFERVVKNAQPWTVMCAYNKLNGTYCSEHHWLLTEVLRDEWGFDGLVVSDWGAVHDRVAALRGGLDLEMPPNLGVSDAAVVAAVRSGELDESVLDESVRPDASAGRALPAGGGEGRLLRHRGASRVGPPGGARVGGAAEERRRRAAAAAGAG